MAAPVIIQYTSRLGFRQWEASAYQPYATNTPTSWTATGLPSGVAINGSTGLISGVPEVPGFYLVALTATNGDGTSDPLLFTVGVKATGYLAADNSISVVWDVVTGLISLDDGTSLGSLADPLKYPDAAALRAAEPLFRWKANDVRVLNLRRVKAGLPLPGDLLSLKLTLKEIEPETATLSLKDWLKQGTGSLTTYRLVGSIAGTPITNALLNVEGDTGTQVNVLAEFEVTEVNSLIIGTFTASTGDVLTCSVAAPPNGTLVRVSSAGTLPAGLAAATEYFVRDSSALTCKLAATLGGAAIDITDIGSGTHSLLLGPAAVRASSLNFLIGLMRDMTVNA